MFEQEVSALLDVASYIEDQELRESLIQGIEDIASSVEWRQRTRREEKAADDAGLCRFSEAWRGRCKKPSVNEAKTLCKEHLGLYCRCGKHAILSCPSDAGAFVCGAPVCKDHTYCDRGRHV